VARGLLLPSLSIPVREPYLAQDRLVAAMKQDKKRIGDGLVMVMLREDGDLDKVTDFTEAELAAALGDLRALLPATR
jgi:3-dehydroquinate synthetase